MVKINMRNAHNKISRACIVEELEAEVTLRHLAYHVVCMLAPDNPLETRGRCGGTRRKGRCRCHLRPVACLQSGLRVCA